MQVVLQHCSQPVGGGGILASGALHGLALYKVQLTICPTVTPPDCFVMQFTISAYILR
jgi:hypothetical protein